MKNIFNWKLALVLVILLAAFLRLWQLGSVPISMTDDEIRQVFTAYSIAHTGRDIFGNFLPVVFSIDGFTNWGSSLFYLRAPFALILPLSPFAARLPDALSSVACVILLYFIVKKLLNEKIALILAFVFSVSVWNIQLSRFVNEANITLFLYLLGMLIYLYSKNKIRLVALSMVVFFVAFYGYSAYRVFFPFLMLTLIWYKFKELGKKNVLIILTTLLIVFGSYGLLGITQNAASYGGQSPFFFLDKQKTSVSVELERRASEEPKIIKTIYLNKFTYWGRTFATNYLTAFSPQYLFLNQEADRIYSIWGRGELYLFELPLLIIGVFYLFFKKRKEFYLLLLLLLMSPLPSAVGINNPTWTARSAFMMFWLYAFIATGIYYLLTFFKKKNYQYLIFAVIFITYLYSVSGYVFQYYYDWSRLNSKYFASTTKELVQVVDSYAQQGKTVIVSGARPVTVLHYAFYNKIDSKIVQNKMNNFPVVFGKITFIPECEIKISDNPDLLLPSNVVYISSALCKYKSKPVSSISTYEKEEVAWNIYLKK